jgi:hypothetical protein
MVPETVDINSPSYFSSVDIRIIYPFLSGSTETKIATRVPIFEIGDDFG